MTFFAGTICDENAECIKPPGLKYYICKCKVGWAGSGKVCGPDIDLDAWPDQDLPCQDDRCRFVGHSAGIFDGKMSHAQKIRTPEH